MLHHSVFFGRFKVVCEKVRCKVNVKGEVEVNLEVVYFGPKATSHGFVDNLIQCSNSAATKKKDIKSLSRSLSFGVNKPLPRNLCGTGRITMHRSSLDCPPCVVSVK